MSKYDISVHVFNGWKNVGIYGPEVLRRHYMEKMNITVADSIEKSFGTLFRNLGMVKPSINTCKEVLKEDYKMNDKDKVVRHMNKATDLERLAASEFTKAYWNDGVDLRTSYPKSLSPSKDLIKRERFYDKTQEMVELYSKKNADYGDSFERLMDEFGLIVTDIHLTEKLARFSQLIKPGVERKVDDESIEDTLIDMANYSVMTLLWMEYGRKGVDTDGDQ